MKNSNSELRAALRRSLKVQSHYAELLNREDDLGRPVFAGIDEWLAFLRQLDAVSLQAVETADIERLLALGEAERAVQFNEQAVSSNTDSEGGETNLIPLSPMSRSSLPDDSQGTGKPQASE